MRAGLLTERITIQNYVETRSESGAVVKDWVDYHKCKADILSNRGSRKNVVAEYTQIGAIELQIRKTKVVDEKMRIIYQEKKYQIDYITYMYKDKTYKINASLIND